MCKNLCLLIIILFMSNEVLGKNGVNTNKNNAKINGRIHNERGKRSIHDIEKSFLTHEGLENENIDGLVKYAREDFISNLDQKNIEKELPFWGTRGRRDSSSESEEYISSESNDVKCKTCGKYFNDFHKNVIKEELDPFWFERGVKGPEKAIAINPFWGNRGRRDEMEPFWGNRGRREETEPFWGNRGRRDEVEPFWGNRGRRDEVEPFWGNRGRRDEIDPFWGNRGRREEFDPFWESRGRRDTKNSLPGNPKERRKLALKQNIIIAMDNIKDGIEDLARIRRAEGNSFWNSRGRDSKLENLFKQPARNIFQLLSNRQVLSRLSKKPVGQNTVLDERMYAEQPHYILIERSSRSSAEDDPFFISRGKKYSNFKLSKGIRDRRGVLEELVKSVRTDPYYIARGKKDSEYIKIGNSTISKNEFLKAKELICSTIDLLAIKKDDFKVKRDVDESERERRTILKKLAAQLQMDPYFVSRGKKNSEIDPSDEHLEDFINHVSDMCN